MSFELGLSGLMAGLLMVYLVFALLNPERFD
ncbi:MAG: K(+)-transporting ATPase subunit F [Vulcanimicrobiota bacterium]